MNTTKQLLVLTAFLASNIYAGEVEIRDMYCDTTKHIFETLKDKYQEIPVISGKAEDEAGSIMTIWTNPTNDSWTIVATKDDTSCIIGVGNKLKVIPYKKHKSV